MAQLMHLKNSKEEKVIEEIKQLQHLVIQVLIKLVILLMISKFMILLN